MTSYELQVLDPVTWERLHLLTKPPRTGSNSPTAFRKNSARLRILGPDLNWKEKKEEIFCLFLFALFCVLPYTIKLQLTWIFKNYTAGTTEMLGKREKGATNCIHILFFANGQSGGGGGFPSDSVIKFISWFRPFMSAFQLKANVCEHVQRQRNKFNVEQSTSP